MEDLEERLRARADRLRRLGDAWVQGPENPAYRAMCVAWLVAVVARFTILESAHGWWWFATLILCVGSIGLVRFGGRIWWALSWVGLAWPYFWLRDWMTQSLVMLIIATVAVVSVSARGGGRRTLQTARALVVLTYFAAAFHKLNHGFFDPDLGCGAYGWAKLSLFLGSASPLPGIGALSGYALPAAIVLTELSIGALLIARPRAGIVLGVLFHIPLTLVLAPAFAFVMLIGYAAALTDSGARLVRARLAKPKRIGGVLALASLACALLTLGLGSTLPEAWDSAVLGVKVASLLGFAWSIAKLPPGSAEFDAWRPMSRVALVAGLVFSLNAATPYLGVQTQHTGAMLSNLRIDEGCWNHLLVPESVRAVDPYLRIDAALMGPPTPPGTQRAFADRERVLRETLWPASALRLLRRNWCPASAIPFRIEGTLRGNAVVIEDLCDPEQPLPRGVGLVSAQELLPNFLTLQKNLPRRCPTACLH